jgi:putative transposase
MKRIRFTDEQIIGILRQCEARVKTADLCWEREASMASFYGWKPKYGRHGRERGAAAGRRKTGTSA